MLRNHFHSISVARVLTGDLLTVKKTYVINTSESRRSLSFSANFRWEEIMEEVAERARAVNVLILKYVIGNLYVGGLICLIGYAIFLSIKDSSLAGDTLFHEIAPWLPAVGILLAVSAQTDLLFSIIRGGIVDVRAQLLDLIHWLLLIGMNIGLWMAGDVVFWWYSLKLLLLAVLGWQIGAGVNQRLHITPKDIQVGVPCAIFAFLVGMGGGYLRYLDKEDLAWGWIGETTTAVIATVIVFAVVRKHIQTIRSEGPEGYPRSLFLKGVSCNILILLFWIHAMAPAFSDPHWWVIKYALTFNVLFGNALYLWFWFSYELERWWRQT